MRERPARHFGRKARASFCDRTPVIFVPHLGHMPVRMCMGTTPRAGTQFISDGVGCTRTHTTSGW